MNVSPEASVEEQIPSWMMIVVVDVDLVAIPLPVAATIEIIRSDNPVGTVVEDDIAPAVIDRARDEDLPDVLIVAARVLSPRDNAVMLMVPVAIVGAVLVFFPAPVLTVIVAIVAAVVLVSPVVLAIVVMFIAIAVVVAILGRRGQGESSGQRAQRSSQN